MRALSALLIALGLAGCLPITEKTWADAPRAPQPGDLVRVETREGVRHVFRVYKTDERAFYGVASDDIKYRVPYRALRKMELRETELDWVILSLTPYF